VNLSAAANAGTINWYATDVSGTVITSGPSYSPNLTESTTYYLSTSVCGSAVRVPLKATISPAAIGGTVNGSTTVTPGSNSTVLTLAGITGTVAKWQSSTDNFVSNIVDIANTANQLMVTNLTQTTSYRAQVQSGSCAPAFSAMATITTSTTLPIRIGSLKASRENNGIRIQWTAYDQQNTKQFEIERSADGVSFTKLTTIASTLLSGDVKYQWLDATPAQGRNYYRIKEVYNSGNQEYSAIVNAVYEDSEPVISVYPNPVVNRNLNLQFKNFRAGKYQVNYTNSQGQVVYKEVVSHGGGYRTYSLPVPAAIKPGLYRLVITSADGATKTSVGILIR
jgi:hypothetical protein